MIIFFQENWRHEIEGLGEVKRNNLYVKATRAIKRYIKTLYTSLCNKNMFHFSVY